MNECMYIISISLYVYIHIYMHIYICMYIISISLALCTVQSEPTDIVYILHIPQAAGRQRLQQ